MLCPGTVASPPPHRHVQRGIFIIRHQPELRIQHEVLTDTIGRAGGLRKTSPLLQNAKEREQSVESHSNAMPSDACSRRSQMQRSESRAESSLSSYAERRMHHVSTLIAKCKMQNAKSESRAENSLSGYAERRMLSNVVQMQREAPRLTTKGLMRINN